MSRLAAELTAVLGRSQSEHMVGLGLALLLLAGLLKIAERRV
jgi:hypothetical protein